MGDIVFHNELVTVPGFNPEFLRLWIFHVIDELDKDAGDISYIFCSDEYLLDVNKQYLNHDYYTDIITFNYNEGNIVSGDIFISVDTVMSNAVEYESGNFEEEFNRVVIHGVLHLCGFDDKSNEDQSRMTELENWALEERSRFT